MMALAVVDVVLHGKAEAEHGLRAAMLMKSLCSYEWVRQTYGDALPDVPWLQRPRPQAASADTREACA